MKHYLITDSEETIYEGDFDEEKMLQIIKQHLSSNPEDEITHEKEFNREYQKKYTGNEVLDFYKVNPKNGFISRLILKGDKTYYSEI